jgi:hypothetical protein
MISYFSRRDGLSTHTTVRFSNHSLRLPLNSQIENLCGRFTFWFACAADDRFGGDYRAVGLYCAALLRQVAPLRGFDFPQPPPFRRGWHNFGIILASLVTQVAVGDVNSVQRATRGSATVGCLNRRVKAHILKRCRLVLRLFLRLTPEVLLTTMSGRHYGVCGLLALPKNSPDLWGQSCWLSALAR